MKLVRSTDMITWALLSSLMVDHATGTWRIVHIALTVVLLALALWELRIEKRQRDDRPPQRTTHRGGIHASYGSRVKVIPPDGGES